jgi:hypothetical protein
MILRQADARPSTKFRKKEPPMFEGFLFKAIGIVESPEKKPVDENWGAVTSRILL